MQPVYEPSGSSELHLKDSRSLAVCWALPPLGVSRKGSTRLLVLLMAASTSWGPGPKSWHEHQSQPWSQNPLCPRTQGCFWKEPADLSSG